MKRFLFCLLLISNWLFTYGQQYKASINQSVNTSTRSLELVKTFEKFGVKLPGSPEINAARDWLVSEYQSFGYSTVVIDSFTKNNRTYHNVSAVKQGTSNEYILVCGHYDTRGGNGANDNGSGTAAILETARIIADLNTTRSIKFINFDGEEEGFTGSQYHVNQILNNPDSLLYLVINIDQIGGTKGENGNDKIICERDEINDPMSNNGLSWLITDTIANLSRLYTTLDPQIGVVNASDYIPFENKGYTVTGLYQYAKDLFGHKAADSFENLDTTSFKEAVKLSIASVIHFAQVPKFSSIERPVEEQFTIYPNPAKNKIHFKSFTPESIVIRTTSGKIIHHVSMVHDDAVSLPHLVSGVYVIEVQYNDQRFFQKLIINKP